jgi:hypothetical protein
MKYPETPGYVAGSDTSQAAAESIAETVTGKRLTVLNAVKAHPLSGLTCDELQSITGFLHQTCSARVTELKLANLIFDTGTRRKTRTGRSAVVWTAVRPDVPKVQAFPSTELWPNYKQVQWTWKDL